ncbi:MAG: glycosyltransferase [Deltaproteobacteria bacterium]|nr:glycosyltransferase [Deltaproteobacteria bacterium]
MTGASIRSRYIAETQARLGIEPLVISSPFQAPADPGQSSGVERLAGIEYHRCFDARYDQRFMVARKSPLTRLRKLTALPSFTRFVRRVVTERQVDVIHGHSLFFCGLAAVFAARRLGIPSIYEVRSLIEDTLVREGGATEGSVIYRAYRWFDDLAIRLADHIITISKGLRRELIERGVLDARITVIANGVDVQTQLPAPDPDPQLRSQLGFPVDAFVLGYIGTLFAYESLEVAIEAIATLGPYHRSLRLLIVGDGPARKALLDRAVARGVGENVRFIDRVPHEQVGRYYGLVDVFVLPRLPNRLTDLVTPLKPLEIMARAKPILASDCGGHRELIIHETNGFLYNARSPSGLVDAIVAVSNRRSELREFGVKAREWVAAHRSWEAAVRPTIPLYEELALQVAAHARTPYKRRTPASGVN